MLSIQIGSHLRDQCDSYGLIAEHTAQKQGQQYLRWKNMQSFKHVIQITLQRLQHIGALKNSRTSIGQCNDKNHIQHGDHATAGKNIF